MSAAAAAAMSRLGAARVAVAGALAASGGGMAWWELRRGALLADFERGRRRYVDSGGESRYPFYGRDHGYEVDYFIELGLEPGDRLFAAYRPSVLCLPHAATLLAWRRFRGATPADHPTCHGASRGWDEEGVIEVDSGRRRCRHPERPGPWWRPWIPGAAAVLSSSYPDWLAWPCVLEVVVVRGTGSRVMTVR
eukprot:CAMPEP_0203863954 /NCGR_PEP_ID=MMETSP0359-20131031/14473_1 /ASSEMBLY_ACC=CAM_ASM_000338 /TAXON_ID=268821 /ORGANISM="Scrippsiella Hangoei, Strain SHTV-5" /LENGTH=192 /DNA_ID=CAMNT_0050781593 /DNA_START=23 /DNA_END=601 /DNA_ORIENTATION=-